MAFPPKKFPKCFRLFLVGDVMLGRGVDQILNHKVDPLLHEGYVKDARDYVKLAVSRNGRLPETRSVGYVWGDAIHILCNAAPDVRIVNLETSVTERGSPWPGKGIHYRMHPGNIDVLNSASIDCCVLSNNHVMDWGYEGLSDTLTALKAGGIKTVGAGENAMQAKEPAVFNISGLSGRVLVFGIGHWSSGVPSNWRATDSRAGVNQTDSLDNDMVSSLKSLVSQYRRDGDIVVLSVHWGSNWDWNLEPGHRDFVHKVLDECNVHIIHGHSSHHIKGLEIYKNKLIIYGCGDFISDYEGINGDDTGQFRDDLRFMYFVDVDQTTGKLLDVFLAPMRLKKIRVGNADAEDSDWLFSNMKRECRRFGCDIRKRENLFQLIIK